MPRDGSNVFSKPAGTTFTPNSTLLSAKMNQLIDDMVADLNTPRPIVAGGTGATTVAGAQASLLVDNKVVFSAKSTNYTALASDNNAVIRGTAALTLSLAAAVTLGANWHITVIADGGTVTVDPNGSELIDGAATLVVPNGCSAMIFCTGTDFKTAFSTAFIQSGASVASTSGTSIDFTSIPSGVKRVTLTLNGVSTNGTANIAFRLGPSTGVETTGYAGNVFGLGTASFATQSAGTTALNLIYAPAASDNYTGKIVLEKQSGNLWIVQSFVNSSILTGYMMSGAKSLAGVLERVSIFTANGTDTFDAGTVNITWEF